MAGPGKRLILGIYNVVYEYVDEQAGRYAGRAAVRLCRSLLDEGDYSQAELEKDLEDLRDLGANSALGTQYGNHRDGGRCPKNSLDVAQCPGHGAVGLRDSSATNSSNPQFPFRHSWGGIGL